MDESPIPSAVPSGEDKKCSFYEALSYLPEGKRIRRLEWSDEEEYGLLKDSFLQIHRNGTFHNWIVSEGDMLALDWVVLA